MLRGLGLVLLGRVELGMRAHRMAMVYEDLLMVECRY